MGVYDSLIDCLSNCEGLYPTGASRVKCYGICLDTAERLLKLDIDEKLITINEGEKLRNYLNDCRQSLSNVENLKNYCAKKYEELLKAQTAIGAPRKPETEQDLTKKLTECYEDCIKYHSDNPTELQTCYSTCDALWGQKAPDLDLKPFEKCFPHGVLELEEFMAKYQRIGKLGFEDWQIVSEVSSAIRKMLGEGKRNICPNLYESILKAVLITLHVLGIDRYEIKKAYTHDLSNEEKAILAAIFPNLGLGDTPLIPLANEIETQLGQIQVTPKSVQTTQKSVKKTLQKISNYDLALDILTVVSIAFSVGFLLLAVGMQALSISIFSVILAVIAIVLKPRWYTTTWLIAVILTIMAAAYPWTTILAIALFILYLMSLLAYWGFRGSKKLKQP